ncbi:hypothetical protein PFICI_14858 [Pestalotiopsis fici W106-1]|uniref:Uncharacterized protein n=1 Tax=Pestalotiopsis fici (strain W106-1 / CGMCC3.15140) TaxID=1229662 RepID=W3WHA0_PESFW|nr:uncharacterized protein PFICI_14858 [Pestalotiopsis fici W106-1]ETS73253.1 hypothetical protein PFICI_14858 [Pestalotiopsis fici W106-1]
MFAIKTIGLTAMLLGLCQAAPAVQARQDIQLLFLCNDPNQVDCLDFQTTPDQCSNIPGGYNDNVSSLNTFSDSSICTFYKYYNSCYPFYEYHSNLYSSNPDCDESAGSIALGGAQDSLPTGFDNTLSSLKCHICFLPEGCS